MRISDWSSDVCSSDLFAGTRTGIITKNGTVRLFGQMWGTPNVEGTDPFCASGKNVAFEITQGRIGAGNSYTPGDIGSAEMYLYIGDNQADRKSTRLNSSH